MIGSGNWRVEIGKQQVGTEIKIVQKSGGKGESIDTQVVVQKEKLPKVIVNPIYNTSTIVEGYGVVGATIKVIDNLRKYKNRNSKFRRKI